MSPADLKKVLDDHALWLRGEGGSRADLEGAYLTGADLRRADLRRADLEGADLRFADLKDADLKDADLKDVDLSGAVLPDGRTLAEYRKTGVEELMALGGHPVPDEAWSCHSWQNCPMACAFGVHHLANIPEEHRGKAALFVALFDGGHIAKPTI